MKKIIIKPKAIMLSFLFLGILAVLIPIVVVLGASQQNQDQPSWKIGSGDLIHINLIAQGVASTDVCVRNNSASLSYFIPYKTTREWDSFSNYKPAVLAFESCCADGVCNGSDTCATCPDECGVCVNRTCLDFNQAECVADPGCVWAGAHCYYASQDCPDFDYTMCVATDGCRWNTHSGGCMVSGCEDSYCDSNGESCANCPEDCGYCPVVCGDAICDYEENCNTCSSDCGLCPCFSHTGDWSTPPDIDCNDTPGCAWYSYPGFCGGSNGYLCSDYSDDHHCNVSGCFWNDSNPVGSKCYATWGE